MNSTGRKWLLCLVALAAMGTGAAYGAVTASVDRNAVTMGDSLQLTLDASDDEDFDERDLAPLEADFEILQRSTSSSTSIVNGRISQSRQMLVELTPRRTGTLQIPSLTVDGSRTAPLTISVGQATDTHSDGQPVQFDAQLDRDSVYVQGQVILTLRVQQSVNLEQRSITPLKLDNAFVKPLEQHSYRRMVDGRPWQVDEVRYAIFPEHSGTLEIPALVFSGRIDEVRRSIFDFGGRGRQLRRSSQPLRINVLPKPDSFGASDWLPARRLTLQESWSTAPDQLRVGDSATRTIKIVGEGLQGAQLPPILFAPEEGLKYYPDQPQISEQETATGLEGIREDSAAVVPTRPGHYVLPEIRIPWWDTQSNRIQYATLPQRTLTVTAAAAAAGTPVEPAPATATNPAVAATQAPDAARSPTAVAAARHEPGIWPWVSAFTALGWLVTALLLWRQHAASRPAAPATSTENPSERQAFKQLQAACAAHDPVAARAASIAWAAALSPSEPIVTLAQVASRFADPELTAQLDALDTALYRAAGSAWNGGSLAACAERLRGQSRKADAAAVDTQLQLYPVAGNQV